MGLGHGWKFFQFGHTFEYTAAYEILPPSIIPQQLLIFLPVTAELHKLFDRRLLGSSNGWFWVPVNTKLINVMHSFYCQKQRSSKAMGSRKDPVQVCVLLLIFYNLWNALQYYHKQRSFRYWIGAFPELATAAAFRKYNLQGNGEIDPANYSARIPV